MHICEHLTMKGSVVIQVIECSTGKVVQRVEKENLIVDLGKTIASRLLGHDAAYINEYISAIGFGTSNTAAAAGQTTLQTQVLTKAVTASYPTATSVMFSATMLDTEGGTNTFREIGLLSNATAKLFSRLVIGDIVKSTLYKIQVDWTITL